MSYSKTKAKALNSNSRIHMGAWIGVNLLSWVIGIVLILLFGNAFSILELNHLKLPIGLGIGLSVNMLHYLYLRRKISISIKWLLFSFLGFSFSFLFWDILFILMDAEIGNYGLFFSVISGSLYTGILQHQMLKSRFQETKWLVPAHLWGWTMALLSLKTIDFLKPYLSGRWTPLAINLSLILVGAVFLAIATGWALNRMVPK